MCGFAGELARSGPPDLTAVWRMSEELAPRGPDGAGVWAGGRVRRSPTGGWRSSTCPSRGAQPMVDAELGLAVVFNGCIYNHRELRASSSGYGYRVLLDERHRGAPQGAGTSGASAASTGWRACSPSASSSTRQRPGGARRATGSGSSRSTWPTVRRRAALRVDAAGARRRRRHRHLDRPGGAAPLPDRGTRSCRRRGRSCAACASSPPATVLAVEPDGAPARARATGTRVRARAASGPRSDARVGGGRARARCASAVERRMVADVPVGVLLSGGLDSSLIVALLAEQGQRGPRHLQRSASSRRRPRGRRVRLLGPRRRASSAPTTTRSASGTSACSPALPRRDRGDERADGLATTRSRSTCSREEVAKRAQGRAVRPGRRRGVRRLLLVPAAARRADGDGARAPTRAEFFDRDARGRASAGRAATARRTTTPARAFVRRALRARPGADTPVDRALRLDTEVMLVDDPVKRVDNMTMAWGLEARTPFLDHELVELAAALPARAQARRRRQGRAQARGARRCCRTR